MYGSLKIVFIVCFRTISKSTEMFISIIFGALPLLVTVFVIFFRNLTAPTSFFSWPLQYCHSGACSQFRQVRCVGRIHAICSVVHNFKPSKQIVPWSFYPCVSFESCFQYQNNFSSTFTKYEIILHSYTWFIYTCHCKERDKSNQYG